MKTPVRTNFVRSFVLLGIAGLVGCNTVTKDQPIPLAATVLTFSGAPTELAMPGEKTTLSWTTENATHVSLEQVGKGPIAIDAKAASGTAEVTLAKETLFVLSARGPGGTDSRSTSVRVLGGAQGLVFDAVPRTISAGGFSTLVWSAPGAATVTLKEVGGVAVDLGGQTQSGSVRVAPTKSTSYELDADGKKLTVAVEVGAAIYGFELAGPAPLPGQMVSLSWETSGGSKLTITRSGMTAPVLTELNATNIVSGTFSETVPASTPVDGLLHYTLELEQGAQKISRPLTVRVGGSVKIDQFTVPGFVRTDASFLVQWKTSGAERVELWADGVLVFIAPDAVTGAQGSRALKAPVSGTTKVKLIASNSRGAVAEIERTAVVIGLPTFNTFTVDKPTIAAGGEAAVLSWNIINARHVRISESGQTVYESRGNLDTGTATVFPNRATTTYVLDADNGAGDAIAPKSVMVTVTAPGILTFSVQLPLGGTSSVTGHTVVGGTNLVGLPNVKKNVAGDAFVDIAASGNPIELVSTDTTATVVDIGPFSTRVFGRPVSSNTISVSPDGYIVFSATAQTGPSTPLTGAIGTQLFPLTIAAVLRDLEQGDGEVSWQVDTVGDEQRLIVQWTNVEQYNTPENKLTFQLQVFTRGKMVFAYQAVPAGFAFASGVVNNTETEAIAPAMQPVGGEVFTYFTETTLPLPMKIELLPYVASVKVPMGWVTVEGSGLLTPGQIAITEINPRPAAGVVGGEWLEITNFTAVPFDLNGWTLTIGTLTHPITTSVVVPANGRLVLAQTADLGQPGAGVTAGYTYGTASPLFVMPDGSGTLSLDVSSIQYASISWNGVTLPDAGFAVRGDRPNPAAVYASGLQQTVCPGVGSPAYGAAAQSGTPGGANAVCFPYVLSKLDGGFFESISAAGTLIVKGDAGTTDEAVFPVALASPAKIYGQNVSTLYVGTNGWITPTLTTSTVSSNRTTPSRSAPIGSIAPFWDDLYGNPNVTNSGMYTLRKDPDGTPGNGDEYTIVSWEGWRVTTGQDLNFQVKFFENGDLEYHYGGMADAGTEVTNKGSSATSWLEDRTGTSATQININSAGTPGIQPNTSYRYTYTP
jgi:hypothetical protein